MGDEHEAQRMNRDSPYRRDDDTRAAASTEVVRLMVLSAVALAVFAGGVYWIRQQPATPGTTDPSATIEVQLMQPEATLPTITALADEKVKVGHPEEGRSSETTDWWNEDARVTQPNAEQSAKSSPDSPSAVPARKQRDEATARFRQLLLSHIAQYQRYPPSAQLRRLQGTVEVVFELRRDGRIARAWVTTSSGEGILDAEAVATLYRAEPLPSIPHEMPNELTVRLPIDFVLR